MTINTDYSLLMISNLAIFVIVVFTPYKIVASIVGIFLLIITYFKGRKIDSKNDAKKSFRFKKILIEYSGLESLFFGGLGLYTMLTLTDKIDTTWIYYLFFNLFILSGTRIRISNIY